MYNVQNITVVLSMVQNSNSNHSPDLHLSHLALNLLIQSIDTDKIRYQFWQNG